MAATRRPGSQQRVRITQIGPDGVERRADILATEEPMQIRIEWEGFRHGATRPPELVRPAALQPACASSQGLPGRDLGRRAPVPAIGWC